MRPIWLITTPVLFVCSSYFSVRLLLQLADDAFTASAYTAVALALALVQYAALPQAITAWRLRLRFSAGLYFATWALLTALSIAASAAALMGDTQRQQQQSLTGSTEYQLILSQITQLQQQSASIQTAADLDTANGYRARALKTLARLPVVQQQISQLRAQLSTLPAHQSTGAMVLFERIGQQFDLSSHRVMAAAYLLVAVLIELALTVSVAALTPRPTPDTHEHHLNTTTPPVVQPLASTARVLSIRNKITQRLQGGQPATS